jgi:DNA polymerase-3 subunit epsilon
MRSLLLTKPLVFIDIESTGLNPYADRIVEISLLKVSPDGSEEFMSNLVNPGIPIPSETIEIHGIGDDDVKDKPAFSEIADTINKFISDCDIAGFNIKRFDLPMLETELRRAGIELSRQGRGIVDLQVIYHSYEQRDLEAAYLKYCGKKLEGMHRSGVDVKACLEILMAQVGLYD